MIDLRRLQVLRAIQRHGSVTAAAQAMHLTPSAASQQVRQLSHDLGVALLRPRGRGVELTPAAHTLLTHADAIHARWEQAQSDLRGHAEQAADSVQVCGFATAVSALLAPAVAEVGSAEPQLTVRIQEAEPAECFDLLFAEEADAAIVQAVPGDAPPSDASFDVQPLLDDPLDLLVPVVHPLADERNVSLDAAAREPWVLGAVGGSSQQIVEVACSAAGFSPAIAHHAVDWGAVCALVAEGLGVALVPRLARLPAQHPAVRVPLRGDPTPSRRILTATRRGGRDHPAVRRVLAAVEQQAARLRADA
ncbi:MAG TPA: LysR family transcriptional regulator [Nocardioidaceae bacterium]|nr:LysR family transcriptional regulator [Nocardioidaceae bacterium]